MRSCSAAGDPWAERLEVSLDTRSLLMLLQAKLTAGTAGSPTKVRAIHPHTHSQEAVFI